MVLFSEIMFMPASADPVGMLRAEDADLCIAARLARQPDEPGAEADDVLGAGDGMGLAQEAFNGAAVFERDRPDAERRRDLGDEAAEAGASSQISSSIRPLPSPSRIRPGFAGTIPASACRL